MFKEDKNSDKKDRESCAIECDINDIPKIEKPHHSAIEKFSSVRYIN